MTAIIVGLTFELIAQAASGNPPAANYLYDEIRTLARKIGCPPKDLDDTVQLAAIRIFQNYTQIKDRKKARAWARTVVRNAYYTHCDQEASWRGNLLLGSDVERQVKNFSDENVAPDYTTQGKPRFASESFTEEIEKTELRKLLSLKAVADAVCFIVSRWANKVEMTSDQLVRLTFAVSTISRQHRRVLLALLLCATVKDAATLLGMPPKTVYDIRTKIINALRAAGLSGRILSILVLRLLRTDVQFASNLEREIRQVSDLNDDWFLPFTNVRYLSFATRN